MKIASSINHRSIRFAGIAAIAACLAVPLCVRAQAYPNKPITLIVPTAPGGPVDVTATINPLIDKAIGYDPLKDFALLTYAVEIPTVLVVNPSLPVRSFAELVAHARANPGKLSYGSGGTGTSLHFGTEEMLSLLGITVLHVPYKSSAPALQGLLGGEINILMPDVGTAKAHIASGKVIALATSGTRRSEEFPNLPTYGESGIPALKGYEGYKQWIGFIAAAGIPQEAATMLQAALVQALRAPKIRESLGNMGFPVVGSTPQQFAASLRSELESNKKMMDSGAVKLQ
jgi:tripartite-type tricarboxylate transporter receptor subunit TctC